MKQKVGQLVPISPWIYSKVAFAQTAASATGCGSFSAVFLCPCISLSFVTARYRAFLFTHRTAIRRTHHEQ